MSGLLLLDLDGVVVYEASPPLVPQRQFFALHDDIGETLKRSGMRVVVLTQRSRDEAKSITQALALAPEGLLAAEDLALAGLHWSRMAHMARFGLCKSLVLPLIERRYGVSRRELVHLDDRAEILNAVSQKGLGFALHAPFGVEGKSVTSFSFAEAIEKIAAWRGSDRVLGGACLSPVSRPLSQLRRVAVKAVRDGGKFFSIVRRAAGAVRANFKPPVQGPGSSGRSGP